MKWHTALSVIFAVIVGFILGNFMLNQYNSEYELAPVFNQNNQKYYFLRQGEYDSFESMEENMMGFEYYIYEQKDNKYLTYVGITKDYDNMMKIQGFFTNIGYTIYIEEIIVNNDSFSVLVEQYDQMLRETEDNQTIKSICSQVLAKYEELVMNSDNTN